MNSWSFRTIGSLFIGLTAFVRPLAVIAQADAERVTASVPSNGQVFNGGIQLSVVATDIQRQIFVVHETIPVQPYGRMTLLYPEWETGSHAPTASVGDLAGLMIHANGQRIEWERDPIDVHAFHIGVPPQAPTIDIDFQFLPPRSAALLRTGMVVLPWQRMLVYPAGWNTRDITVKARLTLRPGLHVFSALDQGDMEGDTVVFTPTSLAALIDAPVYAGRYWRQLNIGPDKEAPVRLDVVADDAAQLAITPDEEEKLRAMVVEGNRVFGPGPYRHYDAIVSLSDVLSPGGGIEHLEESENNLPADYFVNYAHQLNNRDLIVHEYVHSWNGRFKEPADLWTPNPNQPQRGSLLWVYEGQTEFWGRVIAARTGLRTRQETLDKLALDAALVANRKGRVWKSLADSTNDALYMAGRPIVWRDWQRREDYYSEGVLLWLDVDARLREKSNGRYSLDDFAHRFFAANASVDTVSTYTFGDVCSVLNSVAPDDWEGILRRHLESHDDADAMVGLSRSGWRLGYDQVPTETFYEDENETGVSDLDYSIGLQVRSDGVLRSVAWNGPAFDAGLAPGAQIIDVNGQPFTVTALEDAVKNADRSPLTLKFKVNGTEGSAVLNYHGTLRYPRLERIPGAIDWLAPLLAPHA